MKSASSWILLCVFNFLVVAILGTIMRINAVIPIEGILHKNFREAHSHFAFYGWISALIYIFATLYLKENKPNINLKKYHIMMIINQISSYGMIFTFVYKSYFVGSIVCSSVALFCSFAYFLFLLKDTSTMKSAEISWLKAGGFFAIFSSIGIFCLAYLMAGKNENLDWQRAAIYFYLHYQYNGFFLFSCVGFLLYALKKRNIIIPKNLNNFVFYSLFLGGFLGYGLSILWLENISTLVFVFAIILAVYQIVGIYKFSLFIQNHWGKFTENWTFIQKVLFFTFGLAILLKFFLQFISCIPLFSSIFDNLNLVIGYLHLVLLMGISLFFIWNILETSIFRISKPLSVSILGLIFGILLNEIILLILGFITLPNLWGQKLLIFSSFVMLISIMLIFKNLKSKN